jgi:methylmalonyl-CoA mutase N-terminal domain/subunit
MICMLPKNVRNQKDVKREFRTESSIPVEEVYTPSDLGEIEFNYSRDLGLPGTYPFVRGISKEMYREDLWIMGQYGGYGTAEQSNKRYKHLIEQGATGFSIALDLPTQIGFDSDHPMAHGEVGKVGVAIDTLKDMEILFDGISLDRVKQIRTTANSIGPIFVALFLAVAEKQGISPLEFSVLLQNDVLKEYVARGTYIFPPKPSIELCADVIEYCSSNLPHWVPINFCGYHMRDSGCSAVQEIAFTVANAIAYIESVLSRGLHIDQFAPKLVCFFSAGIDLFEEVAKFRAARRVWAKLMKERFGANNSRSQSLRIFSYTLGGKLTTQQPLNNIIRVTLEALGAVLGGVQTLATSSYDEGYATPSTQASTIALRTQQIIAYESGVINTVDPLGGSFYVERMTHEIEKQVWEYLNKIDEMGGSVAGIENRFFQNEIEVAAYRYQKEVENKERVIVGQNEFTSNDVTNIEILKVDPEVEDKQVRNVLEIKKGRDNSKVTNCLAALKEAAIEGRNVIPTTLEAVKAYSTVGEICGTLKEVFGEFREKY